MLIGFLINFAIQLLVFVVIFCILVITKKIDYKIEGNVFLKVSLFLLSVISIYSGLQALLTIFYITSRFMSMFFAGLEIIVDFIFSHIFILGILIYLIGAYILCKIYLSLSKNPINTKQIVFLCILLMVSEVVLSLFGSENVFTMLMMLVLFSGGVWLIGCILISIALIIIILILLMKFSIGKTITTQGGDNKTISGEESNILQDK